uniref:Putative secreted protein n=1 Tax=Ixodes ricinus TaxID=34613 RepID=A0A6B0UUV2_IXORI
MAESCAACFAAFLTESFQNVLSQRHVWASGAKGRDECLLSNSAGDSGRVVPRMRCKQEKRPGHHKSLIRDEIRAPLYLPITLNAEKQVQTTAPRDPRHPNKTRKHQRPGHRAPCNVYLHLETTPKRRTGSKARTQTPAASRRTDNPYD